MHPVGNIGQGQILLAEQAADFLQGEAVYPVGGGQPACFSADLGKVMGRDAEQRGIVLQVAVLFVFAFVEQFDEAAL